MEKASHSRNKTPNNGMALAARSAITGISSQSFFDSFILRYCYENMG
jgi:hypothetical protein